MTYIIKKALSVIFIYLAVFTPIVIISSFGVSAISLTLVVWAIFVAFMLVGAGRGS